MSGRVLPFEGSAHDEAQRLLPWLVNGRLEEDERAWLSPHLAACNECREEAEALRSLQSHCRAAASPSTDVDTGWHRVRARLTSGRASSPQPRDTRWWQGLRLRWQPVLLAAQACLLLLVGGVALWHRGIPDERGAATAATYRTLGDATPSARLVVVFDGGVRESRLRRLLQASGARIVDGPNDAGAYTLAVPAARAATVRDALRTSPDIVLVESLDAGPAQ